MAIQIDGDIIQFLRRRGEDGELVYIVHNSTANRLLGTVWRSRRRWIAANGACTTYGVSSRNEAAYVLYAHYRDAKIAHASSAPTETALWRPQKLESIAERLESIAERLRTTADELDTWSRTQQQPKPGVHPCHAANRLRKIADEIKRKE